MKTCTKCQRQKDYSEFHKNKWQKDGLAHYCKMCKADVKKADYQKNRSKYRATQEAYYQKNKDAIKDRASRWRSENLPRYNARLARHRARKIQATPSWANLDAISQIYSERERLEKLTGIEMHVDHIIPLNGKNVCGFHCETNLQIIPAVHNKSKSNKLLEELP